MTAAATGVSPTWLALREQADAAARARDLVTHLEQACPTTGRTVIHDLGCGTGAMGRWLAPLLAGPQHWIAHDRDSNLLAQAVADVPGPAADGAPVSIEARHTDLVQLHARDLAGASLITASALLDVLTEDEVSSLAVACAGAACPVLLTLSVIGRVEITPADPLDARVAAAFDAHQHRMSGRGRLLGPDAVAFATAQFGRLGHEVIMRPSPWCLGPADASLTVEWFTGWVRAACEHEPELGTRCELYTRQRLARATRGQLAVTVEHADLLILP